MGELYKRMHREGLPSQSIAAEDLFAGWSLVPHIETVKTLIDRTGAKSILDYGAGKGVVYQQTSLTLPSSIQVPAIKVHWNVDRIDCYDPAVPGQDRLPDQPADGVISTDALEHCPEEDLPWIVEEMFGAARLFVFANIASYPAKKRLPNGENAHCTIRPPRWWRELFDKTAARHKARYHIEVDQRRPENLSEAKVSTFSIVA